MSSIDVIIPCYKYGRYLPQCVESILSQDVANLRVLIIDDASPDDSAEVGRRLAAADPRVTLIAHEKNKGHIATFNEGIAWLEAEYMLLISADDFLLPGALPAAIAALDASPGTGLCIGHAREIDDDGRQTRVLKVDTDFAGRPARYLDLDQFAELCLRARSSNIVPTPTAVVRTRLLHDHGGYRPSLPHTGDFEMWLRLAALSGVCVLDRLQAVYRRHSSNMSLEYYRDNCLLDIKQRLAAVDTFAETCVGAVPHVAELRARFASGLAREAVMQASAAFNERRPDLSRQLSDLARATSPDVERTRAWKALALKNLLGYRVTRALLPLSSLAQLSGRG